MSTERVRVEVDGDARGLRRAAAQSVASIASIRTAAARADVQTRRSGREMDRFSGSIGRVNQQATLLRNTMAALKWPALITGAGLGAQALSSLAAGATAVVGALAPLTGTLVAYPAILGAVGQAAVTLKLGLGEVGEALKGNEEALKRLTPQQRQFVAEIKEFKDELGALKEAAGENLLPGLAEAVEQAAPALDELEGALAQTGSEIGRLAEQAGQMFGSRAWQRDIATIGGRNAETIRNLGGAGLNLADALRHVSVAAGPFVGWLTRSTERLTALLEAETRAGRESGALRAFFRETRETLQIVVPMVWDFGRALGNIAAAGKPLGTTILRDLRDASREFREWTESAEGRNTLDDYFRQARRPLYEMGQLLADVTKTFFRLGTQPGVGDLIEKVRTELLPVLEEVIGTTTEAFGPHLIDALVSVTRLLGDLAGSSGPLTVLADTITAISDALHFMFENVPGLQTATVTVLGAGAVAKVAATLAKLSGLGKLAELAGGRGLLGKAGGLLGSKRGMTPANPLFVADVTGGGGGGGKGGKIADWLKGPAGIAALRAATAGAAVALPATAIALLASKVNKNLPTGGGAAQRRQAEGTARPGVGLPGAKPADAGFKRSDTKGMIESFAAVAAGAEQMVKRVKAAGREIRAMVEESGGSIRRIREIATRNFREIRDNIGTDTREGRRLVVQNFKEAAVGIAQSLRDGRASTREGMGEVRRLLRTHSHDGKEAVKRNFGEILDAVRRTMTRGGEVTREGMDLIRGLMVKNLRMYGINPRQALNIVKSGDGGYGDPDANRGREGGAFRARGGLVQFGRSGDSGRDRIPVEMGGQKIIVGSGETGAVFTRHQLADANARFADVGGLAGFMKRQDRPHYAAKGWVGASPAGLNAAVRSIGQWAMNKYGAAASSTLRPGDTGSHHSTGAAVDLTSGNMLAMGLGIDRAFRSKLEELIHTPMGFSVSAGQKVAPYAQADHYDHVHVAAFGKALAAMLKKIKRVKVGGPDSALRSVVQGALDMTRAGANQALERVAGSVGGGDIPHFSGEWTDVMAKIAQSRGWNLGDWKTLVGKESGGDPTAVNPSSGAFGLGQFLGSTLEAYAKYGAKSHNPVEQIHAMAQYIADRYGDPSKALAFHLANNWYARGGLIGYVGDSLGVGTVNLGGLRGKLGKLGGKLRANVREGRGSGEGLGILRGMTGDEYDQFVFDLGTNDPSAAALLSSLHAADRATGHRPLYAMTVNGPAAAAKNAALRGAAGGDIHLLNWAAQSKGLLTDGIHGGYGKRAGMLAAALRATAGSGMTDSTTLRLRPGGKRVGQQPRRPGRKLRRARRRYQKKQRRKSITAETLEKQFTDLSTTVEDLQDVAVNTENVFNFNDEKVTAPGEDGALEVVDELTLDERSDLIAKWEGIKDIHGRQRLPLAERIRATAQETIKKLNEQIRERVAQWKKNMRSIETVRRGIEQFQKNIDRARGEIDSIRKKKGKLTKADRAKINGLQDKIDRWDFGIRFGRAVVRDLRKDNARLFGLPEPGERDQPTPESEIGTRIDRRATWATLRDEMVGHLRPGGIPREVISADQQITAFREAQTPPPITGGISQTAEQRANLLAEILATTQRSLALSEARFDVFRGFAPLMRFAHGTARVPQTGLYMLERDETVVTDPAGPYPPANRASGGGGAPIVEVHVHGELGPLVTGIGAMVDGKIAHAKQITDARSRTFMRAPGRS